MGSPPIQGKTEPAAFAWLTNLARLRRASLKLEGRRRGCGAEPHVRSMKVLFLLHYPGYLRFFDSTIRLLAERGHHVALAFDTLEKQPEGARALDGAAGTIEWLGTAPARGDGWSEVALAVRGTIDYVRYLHPAFAESPYLRGRMRKALPPVFEFLGARDTVSEKAASRLVRTFTALEGALPGARAIEGWLRRIDPDLVVVSPLVMQGGPQPDVVKSARSCGIPTALCVPSWDHLTTKGLMRVLPDHVVVWNPTQAREAVEFHGVPAERIVVTGAQPFDRWFGREPSRDRDAFCRLVGLRPDRPFILFTGSSESIAAPDAEVAFVRRWVAAVRRETGGVLGEARVLVRPHPFNAAHWTDADLSDLENVAVYPREAGSPVDEQVRADYFDSLYHAAIVVGVNTSAMIEAAILGRPVLSILADEFTHTQRGTLHFRYLLPENGGCLEVARSLEEHLEQLAAALRAPERYREPLRRFVERFVRPLGLDVPGTPVLADALERFAAGGPEPVRRTAVSRVPLRAALWGLRGQFWAAHAWDDYSTRTVRFVRNSRKSLKIRRKQWVHFRRRQVAAARRAAGSALRALRRQSG